MDKKAKIVGIGSMSAGAVAAQAKANRAKTRFTAVHMKRQRLPRDNSSFCIRRNVPRTHAPGQNLSEQS